MWRAATSLCAVLAGCASSSLSAPPQIPGDPNAVLHDVHIVTVVAENDALGDRLIAFGDGLPATNWWRVVSAEYGLGQATAAHVVGPALTEDLGSDGMYDYVMRLARADPTLTFGETVFMLYLPHGVAAIDSVTGRANTDCTLYEGFHFSMGGEHVAVAQSCVIGGNLGEITAAASHEIFETVTDPDPQAGYVLPPVDNPVEDENIWVVWGGSDWTHAGAELADMCTGLPYWEAGSLYQRVWSNRAAAAHIDPCVPSDAVEFPVEIAGAHAWFAVQPGKTIAIDLHVSSALEQPDWFVERYTHEPWSNGDTPLFTVSAPGTAVNDGATLTLTASSAPTAASGSYAIIELYSSPDFTQAGTLLAGTDLNHYTHHLNLVGLYTP